MRISNGRENEAAGPHLSIFKREHIEHTEVFIEKL
jgi:hypothetical protein